MSRGRGGKWHHEDSLGDAAGRREAPSHAAVRSARGESPGSHAKAVYF